MHIIHVNKKKKKKIVRKEGKKKCGNVGKVENQSKRNK